MTKIEKTLLQCYFIVLTQQQHGNMSVIVAPPEKLCCHPTFACTLLKNLQRKKLSFSYVMWVKIMIFHQPRFWGNRSCEVAII